MKQFRSAWNQNFAPPASPIRALRCCLLGHSEMQTTERYAHLDRDWVREAAVEISESLAADVLTGYPGQRGVALAQARGGATDEEAAKQPRPFPVRLRARSSGAA